MSETEHIKKLFELGKQLTQVEIELEGEISDSLKGEIENRVEILRFDIELLKDVYKICRNCEFWHNLIVGWGRCANCPEFDSQEKIIENTGSSKFAEKTEWFDSCKGFERSKENAFFGCDKND